MLTLGFLVKAGLLALVGFVGWCWFATDGGFRPLEALSMTLGVGLDLAILAAYEADGRAERHGGSISASAAWILGHKALVSAVMLLLIGSALWDRFHRKKQEQSAGQPDDIPELEPGPDRKEDMNA